MFAWNSGATKDNGPELPAVQTSPRSRSVRPAVTRKLIDSPAENSYDAAKPRLSKRLSSELMDLARTRTRPFNPDSAIDGVARFSCALDGAAHVDASAATTLTIVRQRISGLQCECQVAGRRTAARAMAGEDAPQRARTSAI